MKAFSVIDMFCGTGGLTHGFVKEGFGVVAGFDIDASCRYAYEQNNRARFICNKIEDVKALTRAVSGDFDLLQLTRRCPNPFQPEEYLRLCVLVPLIQGELS